MPFQYKPPENAPKRKKLTKMELQNAIDEIKGGASIRQTSNKYGIDRTTLRRYTLDEDKINKFEEKKQSISITCVYNCRGKASCQLFVDVQ